MKIVLNNLTKRFKNQSKGKPDVIAVNNFNIEIPDGKLVALLGPSGCGKSTCLNLISGLEEASAGEIYFDDINMTKMPPESRGVGMVFQNYALYPHLNVKDNIMFPLKNFKGENKLSKQEMEKEVLKAAKIVQIDQLLDRKPSQLSGGQQQRVAIARALVKKPSVLLLDEPLSNLDARLRLQTREEIRRIQKETNITTIFVTHDQDEAMSISDVIIVMKDGIIQQIGQPQEVYDKPINLFVAKFLGTPTINVFKGYIKNKVLYIGEEKIKKIEAADQEVNVAIRPEGFVYEHKGVLTCEFERIQTQGRDTTIISHHKDCISDYDIRSIMLDNIIHQDKEVKFSIKENKIYVFDTKDGNLINA